jgi:hypothetical protein
MMLHIFIHSRSKRAKAVTLLDSGATENFMNIKYAQKTGLPIRRLTEERRLFNVDGTQNKAGLLKYFTDITTRTGEKSTQLRYYLMDLGENQVILGYPWFASAQPQIDWAKGWIDYAQLPIVLRSDDADQAIFSARTKGRKVVIKTIQVDERIPYQYKMFADVFSNEESKKLPPSRLWDHKIELKPGAPSTLISHTIKLSVAEQQELKKFIDEHLERGTIQRSKSP